METFELSVEDTNVAALIAKLSAIKLGYFDDPYASKFLKSTQKKETIINRGYWARVQAIKMITERFLKLYENKNTQIVSLGAGYDTSYFCLKSSNTYDFKKIKYIELDLKSVVLNKIKILKNKKELLDLFGNEKEVMIDDEKAIISGPDYILAATDLRDLKSLNEIFENVKIDFSVPTLVFAECVLIYISTKESNSVIHYFYERFRNIYFMNWEMMKLNDQFGKVMIKNFENQNRGCELLGIHEYPDVNSLEKRFKDIGFSNIEVHDMLKIYNDFLDKNERKRIEKIEWLDEYEEWFLLQKHYYFALCSKLEDNSDKITIA